MAATEDYYWNLECCNLWLGCTRYEHECLRVPITINKFGGMNLEVPDIVAGFRHGFTIADPHNVWSSKFSSEHLENIRWYIARCGRITAKTKQPLKFAAVLKLLEASYTLERVPNWLLGFNRLVQENYTISYGSWEGVSEEPRVMQNTVKVAEFNLFLLFHIANV